VATSAVRSGAEWGPIRPNLSDPRPPSASEKCPICVRCSTARERR
jgi:hypothetical protein